MRPPNARARTLAVIASGAVIGLVFGPAATPSQGQLLLPRRGLAIGAAVTPTQTNRADTPNPQAVLIRNPSDDPAAPPFALADQRGGVIRLIEPTPTVQLERYVGQVVRVRHDTGGTLLASQLELPGMQATGSGDRRQGVSAGVVAAQHETAPGDPESAGAAELIPAPVVPEEVEKPVGGPPLSGLAFPAGSLATPSHRADPAPALSGGACIDCGAPVLASGHGVGHGFYGPSCPGCSLNRTGLDFSFDALLLRTHDSAAVSGGDDFEFGWRTELGLRGTEGRRLAIRYFDYDTGLNGPPGNRLDLETIDLEFQRRFSAGRRVEWGVGGGLRWAEYDESAGLSYSDSIGPLIGVSARAPAFGAIDGALLLRQSFQFGDAHRAGQAADRGAFAISELQFGLEHRRSSRLGEVFVRGALEAQYWSGVGDSVSAGGAGPTERESSRGLIGFGLGVGLIR